MVMLHSVLMVDGSSTYALLTFCLELHFSVLFRCVCVRTWHATRFGNEGI